MPHAKIAVDNKFDKIKFNALMESGEIISEEADTSLDLVGQFNHEVKLISRKDALYLGYVHIGGPVTQPVKVAFDTGSEFLAVTSNFCDDKTTPEEYAFQKVDKKTNKHLERTEAQKKDRCLNKAYKMQDSKEFQLIQEKSSTIGYGSADLQGFLTQDNFCLQQINETATATNGSLV